MFERKRIDFTNLANKVNSEIYYAIFSFIIIAIIIVLFLFIFKPNNNEVLPKKEQENINENTTNKEENNGSNIYDSLSQIDKARASTFITNVKVLFQNSKIMQFSQNENGIKITEISPKNNSVESTLDYCVKLDSNGNIIKIQAQDSMFYVDLNNINNINEINTSQIRKGSIPSNECK